MPFQEYLEHSCRCWKAQEEHADQLARRKQVLVTVSFAFLGLAVFRLVLESASEQASRLLDGHLFWIEVGVATGFLLVALGLAILLQIAPFVGRLLGWLFRRLRGVLRVAGLSSSVETTWRVFFPRAREPASALMFFPEEQDLDIRENLLRRDLEGDERSNGPDQLRERVGDIVRFEAAVRMSLAASDLLRRNAVQDRRIKWAQRLIVPGLLFFVLAIGLMVYSKFEREAARASSSWESSHGNQEDVGPGYGTDPGAESNPKEAEGGFGGVAPEPSEDGEGPQ